MLLKLLRVMIDGLEGSVARTSILSRLGLAG